MKKLLFLLLMSWGPLASAQFTPGQVLTAAELNSQFALYSRLTGATFTGPVSIPNLTVTSSVSLPSGSFPPSGLSPQSANTVLANSTASSSSPSATNLPSCSTSTSSLQYISGTGFSCFTGSAPLASPTFTGTPVLPAGTQPLSIHTAQSANTLVANATGASASPTAIAAPSCSTSSSALQWTSGAGLACNTSINSATLGGVAAASYLTSATASATYATIAQATTAIAATGGSINGVTVGTTTPSSGAFTTLNASGNDALLYVNTSGQSFTSATPATVTGWTKTFDRVNSNFVPATGIFTAPATGYYSVSGQVTFASAINGIANVFQASVIANSISAASGFSVQQGTGTEATVISIPSVVVSLTAGQTVLLQVTQSTGGARTLSTSAGLTYLSINRLP